MSEIGVVEAEPDWLPPLDESGPPVWGDDTVGSAETVVESPVWLDDAAAWAAQADFGSGVLTPFGPLDPARLSDVGRVDALVALERLQAWAGAQSIRLLAAMAPPPASRADKEWVRDEIALAVRQPPGLVSARIDSARELAARLPDTLALLETGAISVWHAEALAGATAPLTDGAAAAVQARVLPRAPEQNLSAFRAAVRRAVHACDTRAAEQRHQDALTDRRVAGRAAGDGMGELWARLSLDELAQIMSRVDHTVRHTPNDPADPHSLDHRRADALVDLILGRTTESEHSQQHSGPSIQVVLAAGTLLGLDDQPGEIDGYGPIPATLARALAFDPTGTLRRLLVDPVSGKLLDYGRTTYEPPQDLADYLRARDRTCRFPRCTRRARRCEIDHEHAWDDGGWTAPDNCECLCVRHHHAKHEGGWAVFGNPEDELTWVSPTGHSYRGPPTTYDLPPPVQDPDEPAPF